ncbi:MAG: dTDP-4-dehydrorhamnose 3,5-epimerase [Sterolibacterium sp.]|nr:dTDP-4-dehydrorhamnose 3,5-epimerase [Sterolibacterium sp.]
MKFVATLLEGAFMVEAEAISDERGFFARSFCTQEFVEHGLDPRLVQCSVSYNERHGTLRGMHYQRAPYAETKLVRCTMGKIYDVMLDLRPQSPSFMRWHGVELSADNRRAVYIPEGVAHGFLTLSDACEVFYQISEFFHPECAAGVRWNDPAFAIAWPEPVRQISARDQGYPDFAE